MRQNTAAVGICALMGWGAVALTVAPAAAQTIQQRNRAAEQMVHRALSDEAVGYDCDRTGLMQSALQKRPNFAPA